MNTHKIVLARRAARRAMAAEMKAREVMDPVWSGLNIPSARGSRLPAQRDRGPDILTFKAHNF